MLTVKTAQGQGSSMKMKNWMKISATARFCSCLHGWSTLSTRIPQLASKWRTLPIARWAKITLHMKVTSLKYELRLIEEDCHLYALCAPPYFPVELPDEKYAVFDRMCEHQATLFLIDGLVVATKAHTTGIRLATEEYHLCFLIKLSCVTVWME